MEKEIKLAAIQQGDVNGSLALAFAISKCNFSNPAILASTPRPFRSTKKKAQVTQDSKHTPINFYTFDTRASIIASGGISYACMVLKINELDNCL